MKWFATRGAAMNDSTIAGPAVHQRPEIKVSQERKAEILAGLSSGEYGLMEGTYLLGLTDAGWTLDLLREAGMWLFRLDDAIIKQQAEKSRDALRACLKPEVRAALAARR
jgi:hypothetical protein